MVVEGYVKNGVVVPANPLSVPDGTAVTIMVTENADAQNGAPAGFDRARFLEAMARIDAVENENPGDTFSGKDHDQVLYGEHE